MPTIFCHCGLTADQLKAIGERLLVLVIEPSEKERDNGKKYLCASWAETADMMKPRGCAGWTVPPHPRRKVGRCGVYGLAPEGFLCLWQYIIRVGSHSATVNVTPLLEQCLYRGHQLALRACNRKPFDCRASRGTTPAQATRMSIAMALLAA